MFKKLTLLLGMLCYALGVYAQHKIYLTIENPSIITAITVQGKPIFGITSLNTLFNQYTVTGIEPAFPDSRFPDMRKIFNPNYAIESSNGYSKVLA